MRAIFVMMALLVGAVYAQEKKVIDNPEFANWSKFKPGASTSVKTTIELDGDKNSSTVSTKLMEVKDNILVVETQADIVFMGKSVKSPPVKREVKKTVEVTAGVKLPPSGQKPEGAGEEGTETLKVGGKDVKTTWYKFKSKTDDGEVTGQMWLSDDVPGRVVKIVSKGEKFSTTMEMIQFNK